MDRAIVERPNGWKGGSLYDEGNDMTNGAPPDQQRPLSVSWYNATDGLRHVRRCSH